MINVFRFTFSQNTKGKGFAFVTFIFPVIICAVIVMINVFTASGESEEDKCTIEKVYVKNESGLTYLDFSRFGQYAGEEYENIEFITDGREHSANPAALDVTIGENDDEYSVNVDTAKESVISHGEAKDFNNVLAGYVEQLRTINAVKMSNDKASESDILTALMPVNITHTTIGDEDAGFGADLIKMLLPPLIIMVLYFMVIIYGQSIGKIVISEKISKLMETLLITVKPYQLIAGKILAMVVIAALQIIMWVIGVVAGLNIGNVVARGIDPEYNNVIFKAIDLIKEAGVGDAFSAPSVILAVIAIILGFIFFCVLAGLLASPVSKAEELATSTGIFQMIVIIGFLVAYMVPMQTDMNTDMIKNVLYVIPVTSSFMLSGDIMIGALSYPLAIGYMALLAVFTAGLAVYAGKLYKNQVFYNNASGGLMKRLFR